ncbi:hypothetical protein PENSPDRAFT_718672 [Peniophora sp. CONT]|nr:hypothetical protein PENSPDRAFT_718672 [Peniophora sp. CONT]
MISASSVIFALAAISPALADLGKDTLFSNGLPLNALDNLPFKTFTYSQVDVPDICTSHANDAECDTNVEAYQVNYGDCSEPWTLCRCSDAQMDITTLAKRFAQVPPGVRSYVGSALAVAADSCSAGSSGDFIVFNGDCVQAVFDHESGHSLDQSTSPSSEWSAALNDSSCVPDDYANTSPAEDFAQVNVCYIYQTHVGGLPADPSCMQPQLDVFKNDARIHGAITATECNADVRPFQLMMTLTSNVLAGRTAR